MAGRKSDFTLPTNTLDELFSSQEERDEAKLSKIRDIPLEEIDDFPDHPFQVREDEDMFQLVESIKERGVITPATVRQKDCLLYTSPEWSACCGTGARFIQNDIQIPFHSASVVACRIRHKYFSVFYEMCIRDSF